MKQLTRILIVILIGIIIFFTTSKKGNAEEISTQETQITQENTKNISRKEEEKIIPPKEVQPETKKESLNLLIQEIQPTQKENIPLAVNISLTFFPQAPDANWDLPRQEACEEASIILAAYYINNKELTKDIMKNDIVGLVQRQKNTLGDYIHTTAQQTKEMYDHFYGQGTTKIIENPTIDDIKQELAQGHLIVAPFAGRLLGNPHYSGIGPRYHMMVIKGYDDTYFYTHDVGTTHGENFKYTQQTIINANHDYVDGDITQGAKRMIILSK